MRFDIRFDQLGKTDESLLKTVIEKRVGGFNLRLNRRRRANADESD